jgi:CubicO group peptidase (beta-lactamase class C family)
MAARPLQPSGYSGVCLFTFCKATSVAEIQHADCVRAAKYSESRRGSAMLVLQHGRIIFEHYANGGSVNGRWPIFSGTKSFWGIAALAAVHDGLFKLDDVVSDTITEWKCHANRRSPPLARLMESKPPRRQRPSLRPNTMGSCRRLPISALHLWPESFRFFERCGGN